MAFGLKSAVSLQWKLSGVIFALTFTLIAFFSIYFPARQIATSRRMIEEKASAYARLVSRQVESAIAFDDRETVREVFEATAGDRDVHALALYRSNGQLLHIVGEVSTSSAHVIRVTVPVVSREGPTGTLVVELSTDGVEAERTRVGRLAAGIGVGAILLGILAAWGIGRSIGGRVGAVASAARLVAGGDLSASAVEDSSTDEVGQLSRDFNVMTANLRTLVRTIEENAGREQERLEFLVDARTAELRSRNADMRRVLDHVGQGLMTVDRDGVLGSEHSLALADWFGEPDRDATLWSYFGKVDRLFGDTLHVSWDMLIGNDLPLEVAADALPRTVRCGARSFRFDYRPILENEVFSRMLVVASDITDEVERRRADIAQRELMTMVERFLADRTGTLEFVREIDRLLDEVTTATEPSAAFLRALHTIKGNCLLFGLQSIGDLCHLTESLVRDTGDLPTHGELDAIVAQWRSTTEKLAPLLGDAGTSIALSDSEYATFKRAVLVMPRRELREIVDRWTMDPVAPRLRRLAEQATQLAARLGKPGIRVVTNANGIRLDAERWAPFWSAFVHVVRNAVDHGIEPPLERAQRGKLSDGIISIRAYEADGEVVIETTDDGRGIDWGALNEKALRVGVSLLDLEGPHDVLFLDGVSSRDQADESSGRGVGMGAVRAACRALGGRVEVESKEGHGTVMRFVFSAAAMNANDGRPAVAAAA